MPVGLYTGPNTSTGNGVTTVFTYNFKILDEDHLRVIVDGVVKTIGTHYTVSGVGASGGGNVTFVTAPTSGAEVVRERAVPYLRETDYQEGGGFQASAVNEDVDLLEMQAQQLADLSDRSLRVAAGDAEPAEIPSAADRASKVLGFDADGDPTVYDASSAVTEAENVTYRPAWVGAEPTTAESKFSEVLSLWDFMTTAQKGAVRDYSLSSPSTSWRFAAGSAIGAALNNALAVPGAIIRIPFGGYVIDENLDTPACLGIVGDGWAPGTNYLGSVFAMNTGVTDGLDMLDQTLLRLENFRLMGNATTNAWGLRIGKSEALPSSTLHTADHWRVRNVAITGFTGTGAIPLDVRDCNFGVFDALHVKDNTIGMRACLANSGAGTVPADIDFINCTFASSTNEMLQIYSGHLRFQNLRINGAGKEAILIDPASGPVNTHSATVLINGLSMENIYQSDATKFHIKIVGATSANTALLRVEGLNLEIAAGDPKLISADGAYAKAWISKTSVYAQPKAGWITADNSAYVSFDREESNSTTNLIDVGATSGALAASNNAIIEGDGITRRLDVTFGGLTVALGGGAVAYSGTVTTHGKTVVMTASITPSGGATVESAGTGAANFGVTSGYADAGRPMSGRTFPLIAASDGLAASTISGTGFVTSSGNRFRGYLPAFTATSDPLHFTWVGPRDSLQ